MKKINLKGKFDLNKQTISRLNDNEQKLIVGGKEAPKDSQMTIMDTLTCHCDSQMTVMDTQTCHCDSKAKHC
ncbi:MAG: hypothetical protein ACI8ZM_002200 [Crocinitomix sp.]|jgi:hypothetical protein